MKIHLNLGCSLESLVLCVWFGILSSRIESVWDRHRQDEHTLCIWDKAIKRRLNRITKPLTNTFCPNEMVVVVFCACKRIDEKNRKLSARCKIAKKGAQSAERANNNNGTKSETKTGLQKKKKYTKRSWTLTIETAKSKAPIGPQSLKNTKSLFEWRRKQKNSQNTEWISRKWTIYIYNRHKNGEHSRKVKTIVFIDFSCNALGFDLLILFV